MLCLVRNLNRRSSTLLKIKSSTPFVARFSSLELRGVFVLVGVLLRSVPLVWEFLLPFLPKPMNLLVVKLRGWGGLKYLSFQMCANLRHFPSGEREFGKAYWPLGLRVDQWLEAGLSNDVCTCVGCPQPVRFCWLY
jgi:hypothetical protein